MVESNMDKLQSTFTNAAVKLCEKVSEINFLPCQAINRIIPFIDPSKIYNLTASECAKAHNFLIRRNY